MIVDGQSYSANVCDGEAVVIVLAGEATGKGRPRSTRTGRIYTPQRTVRAEARLAYAAQQAMAGRLPFADAVQVEVEIAVAVPASWSKRRRAEALAGRIKPVTKPDVDNAVKLICDALNRVVFDDDRQVVEVVAAKHYASAGAMRITVEPIDARRST